MNLFFWWKEKLTTEIMKAKGLFCGIFSYENGKSIAGSFFFTCRFPCFYLQILWTHCAKVPVPSPSTSPCPAFQISA